MKPLMRLSVSAIAAVAAYYFFVFIFWTMFLPNSSFTSSASFRLVRAVAIWGCTAAVALYTWRHTAGEAMKLLMRLFVTAIAAVAAGYFLILCAGFLPYFSERFRWPASREYGAARPW